MTNDSEKRHPSLERLLSVAREIDPKADKQLLARWLDQSAQTITNWGARGVSKAGAMKAQSILGCSANWVMTGTGVRMVSQAAAPTARDEHNSHGAKRLQAPGELLLDLAELLKSLTPGGRRAAASLIAEAIERPRSAALNAAKLDALTQTQRPG